MNNYSSNHCATTRRTSMTDVMQRNTVKNTNPVAEAINNGAIMLDVRTIGEFDRSKISGARHISYDQLYLFLDQIKAWNAPVIVYSTHGHRSKLAFQFLRSARVQVVNGGGKQKLEESLFQKA